MTKFCKACQTEKPIAEYYLIRRKETNTTRVDSICKHCKKVKSKKWFKENKESGSKSRLKSKLKKRYNITIDDYNTMLINQDGRCAICSKRQARRNLSVDHCHSTNVVRGLLCDKCNMALGLVGDNLEILAGMKAYLQKRKGAF